MNKKQQNQIAQIKKSIDDLVNNYPNISVFVKIIKDEFVLGYREIEKPETEDYKINDFIQDYQEKINDLYNLVK